LNEPGARDEGSRNEEVDSSDSSKYPVFSKALIIIKCAGMKRRSKPSSLWSRCSAHCFEHNQEGINHMVLQHPILAQPFFNEIYGIAFFCIPSRMNALTCYVITGGLNPFVCSSSPGKENVTSVTLLEQYWTTACKRRNALFSWCHLLRSGEGGIDRRPCVSRQVEASKMEMRLFGGLARQGSRSCTGRKGERKTRSFCSGERRSRPQSWLSELRANMELSATEKLVVLWVWTLLGGSRDVVQVSLQGLTESVGLSTDQVRRNLAWLAEIGLISLEDRPGSQGTVVCVKATEQLGSPTALQQGDPCISVELKAVPPDPI
jgi:hypothetical protein